MTKYTMIDLLEEFRKRGYAWPRFHLIGIRSKADDPNQFDDSFYLIDGVNIYVYSGTTNPGLPWLKKPMQSAGTAVLKAGQYLDTWQLGLHRGMYKAWTQAKPITVFRDNNRDDKSDTSGIQQKGLFGINIHRSAENWVSKVVDKWSAGCQVLNQPEHYKQFIQLSVKSKQQFFTYTLLNEL